MAIAGRVFSQLISAKVVTEIKPCLDPLFSEPWGKGTFDTGWRLWCGGRQGTAGVSEELTAVWGANSGLLSFSWLISAGNAPWYLCPQTGN